MLHLWARDISDEVWVACDDGADEHGNWVRSRSVARIDPAARAQLFDDGLVARLVGALSA